VAPGAPEDEADAVVNIYRLANTERYELIRSVDLSALEHESEG
jgi:hypothetical protein